MAGEHLDPQRTCLLFFDTCNLFVNGPSLKAEGRSPSVAASVVNWQRLLAAARGLHMAVVYSAAAYRADGLDWYAHFTDTDMRLRPHPEPGMRLPIAPHFAGTPEVQIIEEIAPAPGDYVFWRQRWSTFHQTSAELSLRSRGIDTILLGHRRALPGGAGQQGRRGSRVPGIPYKGMGSVGLFGDWGYRWPRRKRSMGSSVTPPLILMAAY